MGDKRKGRQGEEGGGLRSVEKKKTRTAGQGQWTKEPWPEGSQQTAQSTPPSASDSAAGQEREKPTDRRLAAEEPVRGRRRRETAGQRAHPTDNLFIPRAGIPPCHFYRGFLRDCNCDSRRLLRLSRRSCRSSYGPGPTTKGTTNRRQPSIAMTSPSSLGGRLCAWGPSLYCWCWPLLPPWRP